MSKTSDFTYTGEMFTASVQPWQELPFHLCFTGGAKLTLNPDGSATFEGDADEAAQMFFDSVIKLHNRQYQALEAAKAAQQTALEYTAGIENQLEDALARIAELEARKPDLYLCRVNRGGEELYSPCGKDYPRGRGYIAAAAGKGE